VKSRIYAPNAVIRLLRGYKCNSATQSMLLDSQVGRWIHNIQRNFPVSSVIPLWTVSAVRERQHYELSSVQAADRGPWWEAHDRRQGPTHLSPDFVMHSLRHTMLTRLGESGVDAFTIMRTAGYGSIAVSQRHIHTQRR
jgi:hypothetical protein